MKIYCDSQLSAPALQHLTAGLAPHELIRPEKPVTSVLAKAEPDAAFQTVDIAFGQPDLRSIEDARGLRWIHLTSAGFTRYDTQAFRAQMSARNVIVTNSSSVYAQACAEHALAFMLAQARRLPEGLASQAANGTPDWLELRNTSASLQGQSVVLLGFGAIAEHLVKLLAPFEMQIAAVRRQPRSHGAVTVLTPADLPHALSTADHVVNILPENEETRGFVGASRLQAMRPGAVFYNIGRGTTVDQEALATALHSGHLGAAWLDVTDPEPLPADHPLRQAPRCYITPHTAGGHRHESESLVRHFLANFRRFLASEPLHDRIM